jgi:putative transposase
VQLDFIRPGRPVENSYIESFNGRLRDECLNVEVFFTLADVREKLERWREDYNQVRPHSALNDQSPQTFATTWAPSAAFASTPWPANDTLAGVVRSAAAANPKPRQLFVRPSTAVKGAAEKQVSEGTSIDDNHGVLREVLT